MGNGMGNGMGNERQPRFGYGRFGRPLWTARDRDAEAIREILRRAGRREFALALATGLVGPAQRHGGFVVEDARTTGPSWWPVPACVTAAPPPARRGATPRR